jgi:hypothetical protein
MNVDSQRVDPGSASDSDTAVAATARVFINYRRDDTGGDALHLYDHLADRFGADNVFLDVKAIPAGVDWLKAIEASGAAGTVVLALIGSRWLEIFKQRRASVSHEPDMVGRELELAFGPWPCTVIPVLIEGAGLPRSMSLPRSLRPLVSDNAAEIRRVTFDEDVDRLMDRIEEIAAAPPAEPAPTPVDEEEGGDEEDDTEPEAETPGPAPDAAHFRTVRDCMLLTGDVVPILGSRVRGDLPDTDVLAHHLATQFGYECESADLAEVAQRVMVAVGPASLHRAIQDALRLPQPTPVHRFLAAIPRLMKEKGLEPRYQMIVSAQYDTALEQAFDAEKLSYDLVVFLGSGKDARKFVHVPGGDGTPTVIKDPRNYLEFNMSDDDELERTLIVKILGATRGREGPVRWDKSYVVTEDQYIDYLVADEAGAVIPPEILNKLTNSHCLFMGYPLRDWSHRVFLKRLWPGAIIEEDSWAIEMAPDELEYRFWKKAYVELLASAPDVYAERLEALIRAYQPKPGG